MILTCPSCRARYVVPDSAIGMSGRKVRCAQCRFSWFQDGPDLPEPPAPPPPSPVSSPAPAEGYGEPEQRELESAAPPAADPIDYDRPPPEPEHWAQSDPEPDEPRRRPRRNPARLWTLLAVLAALLMVGALALLYYVGPQQIAAWLGGGEAPAGDALRFTRREVSREPLPTDHELLSVTGEITNSSDQVQRVPQIRAEVTGADGRVIYSWTIAPPVGELQPHQSATFSSASTDVPRGGRNLSLSFGPVT